MPKPNVISLYSGAGGLDYGFEAAGFKTAIALERDHDSCETLRRSRPRWKVIEDDIFKVSTSEMLQKGGLRQGEVDVLIGGPPCQPFSKAGYWASGDTLRLADPRANTLSAYLRVVEEALPRAFVLENVEGLAYEGKDEGLQLLMARLEAINHKTRSRYSPVVKRLYAADYGVPQRRERVFVVASRDGREFRFPRATHQDSPAQLELFGNDPLPSYRTAWDALADVVHDPDEDLAVHGKWAALLPSIPEGQNYLWHTERGGGRPLFGWRRHFWTFLLKLSKAMPSWTIQAQPGPSVGPFHWSNRRLSARELCRLQTFPDDVTIFGKRSSVQRQVGNAVPSLLAEVLAREIRVQLIDRPRTRGELRLLPPRHAPIPPPEPVERVPRHYLSRSGKHSAHPGTGKGHGAIARGKLGPTLPLA